MTIISYYLEQSFFDRYHNHSDDRPHCGCYLVIDLHIRFLLLHSNRSSVINEVVKCLIYRRNLSDECFKAV